MLELFWVFRIQIGSAALLDMSSTKVCRFAPLEALVKKSLSGGPERQARSATAAIDPNVRAAEGKTQTCPGYAGANYARR